MLLVQPVSNISSYMIKLHKATHFEQFCKNSLNLQYTKLEGCYRIFGKFDEISVTVSLLLVHEYYNSLFFHTDENCTGLPQLIRFFNFFKYALKHF